MPLWNLSKLDDLQTTVLAPQGVKAQEKRRAAPGQYRSSAVRTAVRIAALAAVSYNVLVCGSSNVVGLHGVSTSIVNVDPTRTPLDELFRDRFDENWTKDVEASLLEKAAKKGVAPEHDLYNLVHTAQQESLAPDLRRLTEEEVSRLTRRKV